MLYTFTYRVIQIKIHIKHRRTHTHPSRCTHKCNIHTKKVYTDSMHTYTTCTPDNTHRQHTHTTHALFRT